MAETFDNASVRLSTTNETDIYQAPTASGNVAIALSCMVANVDGTDACTIDIRITDSSNTLQSFLCKALDVPAGASVEVIVNKVVLTQSQKIRAQAETANDLDVTVSVLEIT
jgi:hypothetical protein|tara:strand:- start:151 stop:486 length:336 start_codon:yes stop_codon:yes gene_type:complete